jgi:hypothetical protein
MMMICKVFLMKKSASLEILDMVCAMRSFENVHKDNEEWLQRDACELGFQHMIDTDMVNAATKQMG